MNLVFSSNFCIFLDHLYQVLLIKEMFPANTSLSLAKPQNFNEWSKGVGGVEMDLTNHF